MKVSIRTPVATAKPSCMRSWEGQEYEGGEGAGEDEAGGGDHGAGASECMVGGLREGGAAAFLADAGHEVDVVVDAEGTEENEEKEGHTLADAGVAEEEDEDGDGEAEGREVGEGDGGHEVEGRDGGAEEDGEDDADGEEDGREDDQCIAVAGCAGVGGLGGVASDEHAAWGEAGGGRALTG